MIHERDLPRARLQNAGGGNHSLSAHGDFQNGIDEHSRRELQVGIRKYQAYPRGAGRGVNLGVNKIHSSGEGPAWIGIHSERRWLAGSYPPQIILKYLYENPYRGQIGNGVQAGLRLNVFVGKRLAFGDIAGNRRIDFKFLLDLAG